MCSSSVPRRCRSRKSPLEIATLAILHLLWMVVPNLFKSRRRLELENLFLRHQLNIALSEALWAAPRIHGELLKLGFKIAESTVSK